MAQESKLRIALDGADIEVKCLLIHPMETGFRKSADGKVIPAHHITSLVVRHNGKTVVEGTLGGGISQNPYFTFHIAGGKKGDSVDLTWKDNL